MKTKLRNKVRNTIIVLTIAFVFLYLGFDIGRDFGYKKGYMQSLDDNTTIGKYCTLTYSNTPLEKIPVVCSGYMSHRQKILNNLNK